MQVVLHDTTVRTNEQKTKERPNCMPHLPKSILFIFALVILLFSCFLGLLPRFKCQTYEIDTVQPWMYDGEGGLASHVRLNIPYGVAFHPITGDLFIVDAENHIIRTINQTTGVITTVAGTPEQGGYYGDGGLATRAQLYYPQRIAFSPDGTVMYFADTSNHRVRMVKDGIITTVAGDGNEGFTGDGVPANSTSLYLPYDITVLPTTGELIIADLSNHRIRKVGTNGIITTIAGTGTRTGYGGAALGDGGPATSATLNYPTAVVANSIERSLLPIISTIESERLVRRV